MLFIKNKITRRQLTIKRAFPDAVDLLLICIETGMSIDAGFKRVAEEIRAQSKDLCKRSRCAAPWTPPALPTYALAHPPGARQVRAQKQRYSTSKFMKRPTLI